MFIVIVKEIFIAIGLFVATLVAWLAWFRAGHKHVVGLMYVFGYFREYAPAALTFGLLWLAFGLFAMRLPVLR